MNRLRTRLQFGTARRGAKRDVLVVPVTSGRRPPMARFAGADALCGGAVSRLMASGTLDERPGQISHTLSEGRYARVILVGLGAADRLSAYRLRQAAMAAARWLADARVSRVGVWIDALLAHDIERPVSQWAGGMVLGEFRFERHQHVDNPGPPKIDITLLTGDAAYLAGKLPRIREEVALAESVNYARALAHEPANVIHPTSLAAEARRLARQTKLTCKVLGMPELKRQKMNGLIAVGRGAEHKPCLIQLSYRGAPRSRAHVVLVGKAVTFDTGGYSLKNKDGLEGLKYDKCGGMAVMGVLRAAAAMKLKCNLTGLVPAAENAISDQAYRPGDIITMMNGKTVEIISTDAEGRMILADALTYAQRSCKPTVLIDLATLTGGVVGALGKAAAGLMSNDDALAAELEESGRQTHERLWRLPLWDDYQELIAGIDSDIRNSSGKRDAHCIVGGIFLSHFIEPGTRWAHLDIAGTAISDSPRAATGYGVRLIVDYLRRRLNA